MSSIALAFLLAVSSLSAQPMDAETGRPVDVSIILDASSSMAREWSQFTQALPQLFYPLQTGDRITVVLIGKKEDVRVVVSKTINEETDIDALVARIAAIKCDRQGSILSAGFAKALECWGDNIPDPGILILITDGIAFPRQEAETEWAARWKAAQPIRQASGLERVLLAVPTEEADCKSLDRLGDVFLPHQTFFLGDDDLGQVADVVDRLRELIEDVRVPSPKTEAPPTVPPVPDPPRDPFPWVAIVAGIALLGLALGTVAARKRRTHTPYVADDKPTAPPAGRVMVSAWRLDDRYERAGDATKWQFDVPAEGELDIHIAGLDQEDAHCRHGDVDLLSREPLIISANKTGLSTITIPPWEWAILKDALPGFNLDARCLEEELFRSVTAEAAPVVASLHGKQVLIRLPGANEFSVVFETLSVDESGSFDLSATNADSSLKEGF